MICWLGTLEKLHAFFDLPFQEETEKTVQLFKIEVKE